KGNLANWIVPGKTVPGMGGGMELAQKAKKVIILTRQTDKNGCSKIRKECSLPITAPGCVDMIITDMAVYKVRKEGLMLTEIYEDITIEEVLEKTEANVIVADAVKKIPIGK
ncbi:MAG TPA: CoA-transferase, partial [Lachnospiraceae bacterium]|nr:CoA-transferase [Lachnospiraceae bacterium]